ncbi:MAG: lipocalin family protein [Candidatus Omnitrophota bacterium]
MFTAKKWLFLYVLVFLGYNNIYNHNAGALTLDYSQNRFGVMEGVQTDTIFAGSDTTDSDTSQIRYNAGLDKWEYTNDGTNYYDLHTHSNKATLDGTQESFTTALKNFYDGKVDADSSTYVNLVVKSHDSATGISPIVVTGQEITLNDTDFFHGSEADPVYSAWDKSTGISITASQVSDFDTEVSNNTDVAANTSARHTSNITTGFSSPAELVGTWQYTSVILEVKPEFLSYVSVDSTGLLYYLTDTITFTDDGDGTYSYATTTRSLNCTYNYLTTPEVGEWVIISSNILYIKILSPEQGGCIDFSIQKISPDEFVGIPAVFARASRN